MLPKRREVATANPVRRVAAVPETGEVQRRQSLRHREHGVELLDKLLDSSGAQAPGLVHQAMLNELRLRMLNEKLL